jgi:mercuric ion binding protein
MHRLTAYVFSGFVMSATVAVAEDTAKPTEATYSITGLHCPPCTRTVESSLKRVKGVRSVKVDWNSKTAKIAFDENALSAQKLAQTIAATPHMMGGGMHYGGWLTLKVPELKDEATAMRVKEALEKQKGVKRVVAYPKQHAVNVEFDTEGSATTHGLLDAVASIGLSAATN